MAEINELRLVWYLVVLIGIGYLFPFSALTQPIDFWNLVFPDFNIEFPLSALFMWTNLIVLGFIVFAGRKPSYTFRIVGGFTGQLIVLIIVPSMYFLNLSEESYYATVMIATALAATATALVDSVAISFASRFPKVVIEALQLGIGLSTLIGNLFRVFTKLYLPTDIITSSMLYFYTGAFTILICILGYYLLLTLPIVQKYLTSSSTSTTSSTSTATTNITLAKDTELGYKTSSYHKEESHILTETTHLLTKSHTPTNHNTPHTIPCCGKMNCHCGGNGSCQCAGQSHGVVRDRWAILHQIVWYEFLVFLTYFSSMLVWPGIITEIQSYQFPNSNITNWFSLLLLLDFAIWDCIGRLMTPYRMGLTASNIHYPVFLRIALLPIIFLSAMGYITSDWIVILVIAMIGYSNGYLGSVCIMITTEQVIQEEERTIAGGYTGFFLNLGLVLGTTAAYASELIVKMH